MYQLYYYVLYDIDVISMLTCVWFVLFILSCCYFACINITVLFKMFSSQRFLWSHRTQSSNLFLGVKCLFECL